MQVTKTGINSAILYWETGDHALREDFNRATFKGHGRPTRVLYAGYGDDPWDKNPVEAVVELTSSGVRIAGQGSFGVAHKFWARPLAWATTTDPVKVTEHGHGGDRTRGPDVLVATGKGLPGKVPGDVKAPSRSRNGKLHDCLCGCGTQVRGMYAQGHDARHVSKVVAAASGLGHDTNFTEWIAQELPTEALRAKAARAIAKLVK